MKISVDAFSKKIASEHQEVSAFINSLNSFSEKELTAKPNHDSWSVVECIEHMTAATNHYLDQMDVDAIKSLPYDRFIKLGWVASFLANLMRPKKKLIRYKMNTLKPFIPKQTDDVEKIIDSFKVSLQKLEAIIELGSGHSLNQTKVVTAIGPILRFNLAEALNFMVAHNSRHIQQASNILAHNSSQH